MQGKGSAGRAQKLAVDVRLLPAGVNPGRAPDETADGDAVESGDTGVVGFATFGYCDLALAGVGAEADAGSWVADGAVGSVADSGEIAVAAGGVAEPLGSAVQTAVDAAHVAAVAAVGAVGAVERAAVAVGAATGDLVEEIQGHEKPRGLRCQAPVRLLAHRHLGVPGKDSI